MRPQTVPPARALRKDVRPPGGSILLKRGVGAHPSNGRVPNPTQPQKPGIRPGFSPASRPGQQDVSRPQAAGHQGHVPVRHTTATAPAAARPPSQSRSPQATVMAQGQRPAPQSRAGTPQRFENRALAATSQAGKNQQPMRSSSARGPDYMVHPPTQLGGRLQQIKVTVKGTQQLAGSVNIYPTSGGQLFISNLKVERAYRKRGIASQLMNAALTAGRNQGFSGARLEARPFDTGISSHALVSMYRKMGFKSVGKSGSGSPMMERNL